jgi:hypothetical protein
MLNTLNCTYLYVLYFDIPHPTVSLTNFWIHGIYI